MNRRPITLPKYDRPAPVGQSTWQWILFFLSPHKKTYGACLLVNLLRQSCARLQPLFLGLMIGLLEKGTLIEHPEYALYGLIIYFIFFSVVYLSIFYVLPISGRVMDLFTKHLSLYAFRHYLDLPESWHENRASGEKLQRLLKARDTSFYLLEDTLWRFIQFPAVALSVFVSIVAIDANWYYIPMFYLMVGSYGWLATKTGNNLRPYYKDYYKTQEDVVGKAYEFLSSTSTVRFFNLRKHIMEQAGELEATNHEKRKTLYKKLGWRWLILDGYGLIWITAILGIATYDAMYNDLSIAAYSTIIFSVVAIWLEIEIFAILYAKMIDDWQGIKRLTEMLNQRPSITDAKDAHILDTESAAISFDNITFEYQDENSVLRTLNLDIPSGQKVGLIGSSGAGKSTLIKLLLRFYDVNAGAVKVNEHDIRQLTRSSLQEHISVIPQDASLFNHSLMENIRYGKLDASDTEVINAARRAHALEFIENLPDGFETIVGERGVKLSGGQRQRIAIARAILKDAPILILDEATSALDSESEQHLQESLRDIMAGKTVIAIAHRLSTIKEMDRLIVMQDGQIVEDGTHESLIKDEDGLYAKLWSMQSGSFIE